MGLGYRALENIAERVQEDDGGLYCPEGGEGCSVEDAYPIEELDLQSWCIIACCPVHGRFGIDVSLEWEDEYRELVEDQPYQKHNV